MLLRSELSCKQNQRKKVVAAAAAVTTTTTTALTTTTTTATSKSDQKPGNPISEDLYNHLTRKDRASSWNGETSLTAKSVDQFLSVNRRNVLSTSFGSTESGSSSQRRRKSLNDFVTSRAEKLSSACQKSLEFGKLKVSVSASHIFCPDSIHRSSNKALKRWLMSIQRGLSTEQQQQQQQQHWSIEEDHTTMSPEQSSTALCGRDTVSSLDGKR